MEYQHSLTLFCYDIRYKTTFLSVTFVFKEREREREREREKEREKERMKTYQRDR